MLAADADTLDGWGGTLALVDELARHKSEENFGLLRDGLGPRDGRLIAFSTAGDDENSALGRLRGAAHEIGLKTDPENTKHRHVRRDGFAFHEWSLANSEEADDLALVLLANPASWLDETELRKRRDSPSMQKWQWQRFTCGLWVAGEESAISPEEWSRCGDPDLQIPTGSERVVIGGDLGYTRDCTAFVASWKDPDGLVLLDDPVILEPPGDGTSIDVEDMVAACHEYAERYPGCSFAFDEMAGGQQLLQRLEREIPDSEHIAYPKQSGKLCGAAMNFAELISTRKLRHPDHQKLTDHVLAAAARFVGERWRFVKPRGKDRHIDGVIAASIAAEMAGSIGPPPRSVYEARGLVVG